ncbi:MAG TPA: Lrp/AsnC family transcriptional regulator, partial [Candidatus Hodarchaeales archaeon]|nr:Lrp/AsnC family transcriptional regulator [Candidatus Hodarchaeales archaeon]
MSIDDEFRNTLSEIWQNIQELVSQPLRKNEIPDRLRAMADEFYDRFKNSPIPVLKEDYEYKTYSSVHISLQMQHCFMIPYYFYSLAESAPVPPLEEIFSLNLPWNLLLIHIYEVGFAVRKHLRESEVRIIKALSANPLKHRLSPMPFTRKLLAKDAHLDESTVIKRLKELLDEKIVVQSFMLNPFKIGYLLDMFLYPTDRDADCSHLDSWTLFKTALFNGQTVRAIVRPSVRGDDEDLPPYSWINHHTITSLRLNNNLTQLNASKRNSFTRPPIFEAEKQVFASPLTFDASNDTQWISALLDLPAEDSYEPTLASSEAVFMRVSPTNSTLRRLSPEMRITRVEQVLKPLSIGVAPNSLHQLSVIAGLPERDTAETLRFLIDHDVVHYFIFLKYIDCHTRFYVVLQENMKSDQQLEKHPRIKLFLQNMLEFPFSC